MVMNCRMEPIAREQVIAKYLSRSLDSEAVEEFEGHYLGCDECFDELRVSERPELVREHVDAATATRRGRRVRSTRSRQAGYADTADQRQRRRSGEHLALN